jgi:DoxX-like family
MDRDNTPSKSRRLIGMILMVLGSIILIASAGAKFAHVPKVVNELGAMGFDGGRLTAIAVIETVSALLFLTPVTRSLGLLLISAYLGGAIATHVQHGQPFFQPAIILAIIWAGAWLRHPSVLWSFSRTSPEISYHDFGHEAGALKRISGSR